MSVSKIFDIPMFYYFQSGNNYSGNKNDFNYKIINSDTLKILVWHGNLCSELAEIELEMDFEKSEQGFNDLINWLDSAYKDSLK